MSAHLVRRRACACNGRQRGAHAASWTRRSTKRCHRSLPRHAYPLPCHQPTHTGRRGCNRRPQPGRWRALKALRMCCLRVVWRRRHVRCICTCQAELLAACFLSLRRHGHSREVHLHAARMGGGMCNSRWLHSRRLWVQGQWGQAGLHWGLQGCSLWQGQCMSTCSLHLLCC